MKKIPTVFTRIYEGHRILGIRDEITPGGELAFYQGIATIKVDGSCCAIIGEKFYKRYDAKKGKKPPVGAIPSCDPDPVTGHWPHWIEVDPSNPNYKWLAEAFNNSRKMGMELENGTYEAIGPHFQGNPYELDDDILIKHGIMLAHVNRDFESISQWLNDNAVEGLVFWLDGEPVCKIKRTDFGYEWPVKSR